MLFKSTYGLITTMTTPIQKLIKFYGSATKTADGLSKYKPVTRQAIDVWVKNKYIPYYWGATVEQATAGKIKASDVFEAAAKARR